MGQQERQAMKVVGRRGNAKVDVVTFDPMQRAYQELRRGRPFIPKGVWRFKSFEDADAWLIQMLTRAPNPESQR